METHLIILIILVIVLIVIVIWAVNIFKEEFRLFRASTTGNIIMSLDTLRKIRDILIAADVKSKQPCPTKYVILGEACGLPQDNSHLRVMYEENTPGEFTPKADSIEQITKNLLKVAFELRQHIEKADQEGHKYAYSNARSLIIKALTYLKY